MESNQKLLVIQRSENIYPIMRRGKKSKGTNPGMSQMIETAYKTTKTVL